jgi:hypothetical protein
VRLSRPKERKCPFERLCRFGIVVFRLIESGEVIQSHGSLKGFRLFK